MSEPASKRRRVEPEAQGAIASASTQPTVMRSQDFWFDDGNVILQVEGTQFRVHRSMLARQSPIFKDMFAMPQPEEPIDPVVEGCPVITLSDRVDDVRQVLSIFYDNINFLNLHNKLFIGEVAAMLRLGIKYEIAYLQDEALRQLRVAYPTTLEGWDNADIHPCDDIEWADGLGAAAAISAAICLARDHAIPTTMPSLLFCYAINSTPEEILEGSEAQLPTEARIQCSLGRDRFIRRVHDITQRWIDLPAFMPRAGCCAVAQCRSKREGMFKALVSALWPSDEGTLTELRQALVEPASEIITELCQSCSASVLACYQEARKEIWAELPTFFGLPTWGELKDFDG